METAARRRVSLPNKPVEAFYWLATFRRRGMDHRPVSGESACTYVAGTRSGRK